MRPTVRQLEYAVAVAEHLSFRRAAEASAVTQPALSAQIQQLEALLGVQLFERDRRRVLLTAAGAEIVAQARAVLGQLDRLAELAHGRSAPLTGPLRLGVIPTIAPYLLPRVLPAVRRAHPALQLSLREDQTARLVEQLGDGRLDLLLLALPVEGVVAESMTLYDEPFLFAAPADHPLSGAGEVGEAELSGHGVLLLEDGHCLRDQALSVCAAVGARESDGLRATSLGTLAQMVANGLGVTLLPELSVDTEAPPGSNIAVRPFREPAPTRTIGLMWRRTSARGDEYRLLGELLRDEASRQLTRRRSPPARGRRG
jgi:LysR family transcriptional regulator, hydrogen peroxide-inducible genes activator